VVTAGLGATGVREARAPDVPAVAAVHSRAWRAAYAGLLDAGTLDALTPEALAAGWETAVTRSPSPRHAVLVALSDELVIGFAAVAPSGDADAGEADGEVVALAVDPAHQRAGHGSRLLAAATDRLREAGFTSVAVWTPATDDPRRAFLAAAGLAPDGATREYAGQALAEVRYRASLGAS
jgi:ribosomal protein S18 acetylase RimI-like enzyme